MGVVHQSHAGCTADTCALYSRHMPTVVSHMRVVERHIRAVVRHMRAVQQTHACCSQSHAYCYRSASNKFTPETCSPPQKVRGAEMSSQKSCDSRRC